MYALLYRSSATCPFDTDAERDIVEAAQERNGLWSIAALLLYGPCADGRAGFAQWIEGEHESVEALFRLVSADPRHDGVAVLGRGEGLGGAPLLADHAIRSAAADPLPGTLGAFLAAAEALSGPGNPTNGTES